MGIHNHNCQRRKLFLSLSCLLVQKLKNPKIFKTSFWFQFLLIAEFLPFWSIFNLIHFFTDLAGATHRLFHKKKKHILLTFLMLINLIKIKFLLIPVVIGIHMIKKFIILGGLLLPTFLAQLRICKAPYHSFHIPWGPAEPPVDYGNQWYSKTQNS